MINFIPIGKKYIFSAETLIKEYPDYMLSSIEKWLWGVLGRANVVETEDSYLGNNKRYIKLGFLNILRIEFREVFPQYWGEAFSFIYSNSDRTSNFIAFCLQNFANGDDAGELEYILSKGGSGYEVTLTKKDASEYDKGVYDLTERVPKVVKEQVSKALSENDLLNDAWLLCYSRNPDYEKVVVKCQNFLEELLRNIYEPGNSRPQLGKLIGNLKTAVTKLKYKGETVVTDKGIILLLIDNIAQFRGMHTAGTGKVPSKEEAEYVLHTTIYIWNLHQK